MSTRSAESRDNSPDAHDGSADKRQSKKRKVLSCYACRNRKMKCDRVYPVCGRCQKTGRADQCTYDPRLLEDLPVNGDGHVDGGAPHFAQPDNAATGLIPSDTLIWKFRVQERRLEMLEKKLAAVDGAHKSSFDVSLSRFDDFEPDEPQQREEMMFRGKAFKTQFYGSTSPLSALTQFVELQAFTREALVLDGNMGRIRNDFKAFRNRRKAMLKEKALNAHGSNDEIFALVPEKSILDPLVALYFQTWETSYRILHEPTFWKDYHTFWERRSNDESFASFSAILVHITAITKCLKSNDEILFVGDSSVDREDALSLIDACDAWRLRQSRKHTTLVFFQLQCLSLLAKRANCLKLKQDWTNSGDVIRLSIASGIHRNSVFLSGGRITEFDKEMRRRLWVTIVELELQSSIDCGLQSSACGLYFDVQAPANLPDDAFSPDIQQLPASRPIEHFTSASYLNMTLRSLPLRLHLLQLLNNPTTDLHYSDVLHYDAQLNSLLSSLPRWDDPRAIIPSALLEFQLRQFLLILHRPYAKLAAKNQRYVYSFTACVDAAGTILSSYENLISNGTLSLNHLRNDVLRATITLAQVVYHNCSLAYSTDQTSSMPTPASSNVHAMDVPAHAMDGRLLPPDIPDFKIPHLPANNFLASTLCTTAISLLEKARQLFEHKVMRLGTGYMEYWLICSAIGIMPATNQPATSIASITNTTPDDLRSRGRKALERVTSLCFRVLALQKDSENSFASALRASITVPSPATPLSSVGLSSATPLTGIGDNSLPTLIPGASGMAGALMEGKNFGEGAFDGLSDMQVDLTGWTFPDFWSFDMAGDF